MEQSESQSYDKTIHFTQLISAKVRRRHRQSDQWWCSRSSRCRLGSLEALAPTHLWRGPWDERFVLVKPGSYTVRLWRLIHNAYSSSYFIEPEAWLQRACRSLLSSSAAEDWQRINPFLSKTDPFLTAKEIRWHLGTPNL